MFVDINAYVGHWPFRNLRNNSLEGLDELARDCGITHMVVANLNGLFYKDANVANLELKEQLDSYSGETKFIPMAIVNPTYPGWEKDAEDMINNGFCGFELAPLYHGYSLAPEMLYDEYYPIHRAGKVMELAQKLNVPVRVCASFENFRGRSDWDTPKNLTGDDYFALVSKYKDVTVLATGFNPIVAGRDFGALIKERTNIFFDTTQILLLLGRQRAALLNAVSQDQMCFGSCAPFNYIETNLIRVELSKLDGNKIKKNGMKAFSL